MTPDTPFQILALDGGGAKALFTAHVLARLEDDMKAPIVDSFDLVAGTSAGGIIALGLGAGLSAAQIRDHFDDLVQQVFPARRRRSPRRLLRPAYNADALRAALESILGDKLLGESTKRLIVPSWDLQMGSVHLFKTPHHERLRRDWKVGMVDVAMATSAAPTYFPAAHVDGHRLIDGGVWANNPSAIAVAEAVSMLDAQLSSTKVLNVGTMDANGVGAVPRRLDRGGLIQWGAPATGVVISAGSRGGQGLVDHLLGQARYHRFDALVPGGLYNLDRIDSLEVAAIAASASRSLTPVYAQHFAAHQAAPYAPTHGPESPATSSEVPR